MSFVFQVWICLNLCLVELRCGNAYSSLDTLSSETLVSVSRGLAVLYSRTTGMWLASVCSPVSAGCIV